MKHVPGLLELVGAACLVYGVGQWSTAAAWVVAGVCLLVLSFVSDRGGKS